MQKTVDLDQFRKSLTFLFVDELKTITRELSLSEQGKKMEIILRIVHFISTGEKILSPKIPQISFAKRGEIYPLHPHTLMLKGSYKNDLKTRLFFKTLIGEHFHFTAFGIDWLNNRLLEGNPPTYQEFADMWQSEIEKRTKFPKAPKEEWAYINFVQQFLKTQPNSPRSIINDAWEKERQKHKKIVYQILSEFSQNK